MAVRLDIGVVAYARTDDPVRAGVIQILPSACLLRTKSASVRVDGPTIPRTRATSSLNTNATLSLRVSAAYATMLVASCRGVSMRGLLHLLSWPSRLMALTAKHRLDPFVRFPTMKASDTVDPSKYHGSTHVARAKL